MKTDYMSLSDAAKRLPGRPCCRTLLRWVRDGVMGFGPDGYRERVFLAARKIGGRWFISPAALETFIAATTPPTPQRHAAKRWPSRRSVDAMAACRAMGLMPTENKEAWT